MTIKHPATLASIFRLSARHLNTPRAVTEDDVRAEMRRYLTATSPDAKAVLGRVSVKLPNFPLSEDGTAILVDTEDPTAPDGYGRTYYLTLTEIPR
jgi:hypothetical protein